MIQRIIESVVVYKNRIEVVYKYASEASESPYVKPHPCGFLGDSAKNCICTPGQISRYEKKLSGPILDRIDLHVSCPSLEADKLTGISESESSNYIRKRVQKARKFQEERFKNEKIASNGEMSTKQIKEYCKLDKDSINLLHAAISQMKLSARGYHRIIKVARTIADLEGSRLIKPAFIAEGIQYRVSEDS